MFAQWYIDGMREGFEDTHCQKCQSLDHDICSFPLDPNCECCNQTAQEHGIEL